MMYRINAPIRKDDSSKAIFANKQTIPKASNTGNAISFKIIFTKKNKDSHSHTPLSIFIVPPYS